MATGTPAVPADTGSVLLVDLDAVVDNYRLIAERCPRARVGASVKNDAYGLGAGEVARALAGAGCATFFVATASEGAALRRVLAESEIVVLNGPERESADLFAVHRLTPTLNSLHQIALWREAAAADAPPAWLHVDTGMARLGLPAGELDTLAAEPACLDGVRVAAVTSHLACADIADHPLNRRQHAAFVAARDRIEAVTGPLAASLANSPGVFLGPDYHFDIVRPGAALYGLRPFAGQPNPMRQVVQLFARIVQVRDVDTPMTVGYGAAHRVEGPSRIATVAAGYGDGYPRAAGLRERRDGSAPARAYIGDRAAPLVGRVSMDLLAIDVSGLPRDAAAPGTPVELIGPHVSPDELAECAGTIGYEVLSRLGRRSARIYRGGTA